MSITEQPQAVYIEPTPEDAGPVVVKVMTRDDVYFATSMTVEAFRDKFVNSVGESNLEKLKDIMAKSLFNSPQWVYERGFIAFYNGERAGHCKLKFHGDKEPSDDDIVGDMGCCLLCRLMVLDSAMNEEPPRGTVYVEHICVDSKFRGKGIGKVLLDRADYEARKINAKRIYLTVTQDNRARNLYTRHGYEIVDAQESCCAKCLIGVGNFYSMSKPL